VKTCIEMTGGKRYVVEQDIDEVAAKIGSIDGMLKIPGTEGRDDFYINPLQVSAIYPARDE
jgi:hypothetical protein